MKQYLGRRSGGEIEVTVNGTPLNPRFDLEPGITADFEWGYDGTGPSRLAVAILADCYGNDEKSVALHRKFARAYLAQIRTDTWRLDETAINSILDGTVESPMTLAELMQKARDLR